MDVHSEFWGGSYTPIVNRSPLERSITRLVKKLAKRQELMLTLNGAAAGSAANASRARVAHSLEELGGVRSIETYNEVSRNTTSQDKTDIDSLLSQSSRIATPANAAGDWPA